MGPRGRFVSRVKVPVDVGRSSVAEGNRVVARRGGEQLEATHGSSPGAIGMCLTGGFALAMMTEPAVIAPVLSQPSLPLPFCSAKRSAAIGLSPDQIACAKRRFETEDLSMIGLRFHGDKMVPDARFATYKREFGDRFEPIEIDPKDAAPSSRPPHSVLTVHFDDRAGTPTKRAEERVIAFLRQRTAALA